MTHLQKKEIKLAKDIYKRDGEVYLTCGRILPRDSLLAPITSKKEQFDSLTHAIKSLSCYADKPEILYEKAFALLTPISEPPALPLDINTLNIRLKTEDLDKELAPKILKLYQIFREALLNIPSEEVSKPLMTKEEAKYAKALRIALSYEKEL